MSDDPQSVALRKLGDYDVRQQGFAAADPGGRPNRAPSLFWMFAFDQDIVDASNNADLPAAYLFAIQRLAELVGPGVHFSQSAGFVLTRLSGIS